MAEAPLASRPLLRRAESAYREGVAHPMPSLRGCLFGSSLVPRAPRPTSELQPPDGRLRCEHSRGGCTDRPCCTPCPSRRLPAAQPYHLRCLAPSSGPLRLDNNMLNVCAEAPRRPALIICKPTPDPSKHGVGPKVTADSRKAALGPPRCWHLLGHGPRAQQATPVTTVNSCISRWAFGPLNPFVWRVPIFN